jgi:hypothetical protein
MNEAIRTFFKGKKCDTCIESGIRCETAGVFSSVPAGLMETVIFVDEKAAMRTYESIAECPVLTGEHPQEAVVEKIKKNAEKASHLVRIDTIGNY